MKRMALATLVLLIVCGGSIQAQSLSAEKIKNPGIRYAPATKLKEFPLPAIALERAGLASEQERDEVLNKIVYPLINKSPLPIAAVVVNFLPINPHAKTQSEIGFRKITVSVLWHNGNHAGALFEKNKDGHFDDDAYAIFLGEGDGCCSEDECETGVPTPKY
jgi:hypothetical protein